jgi:predicted Zn-dependent peptidase
MSRIVTRTLANGLVVVLEPNDTVGSVALRWMLPAGSAVDPPRAQGYSTILSELIFRGCGGMTSRDHSDALDRLGIQRDSHVQTHHLRLDATFLTEHWRAALDLLAPMVLDPALPAPDLEAARRLCLQSLDSLEDDPAHLVMLRLRERHLPPPFNRHGYGEADCFRAATIDDMRGHWRAHATPGRSIIGIAGRVDADQVVDHLQTRLAEWRGGGGEPAALAPAARGSLTIAQPTAQVHLGVAFDAPREADPQSVVEQLAIGVLSGSTSGRLFTEVRQKRSLCYSVGASYRSGRDQGMVTLYAGTTPERAQETLDVCIGEIMRLKAGVADDEFRRVVTGLRSQLVMQGESTRARASAIAHDQFRLGRARSLEAVAAEIDAVSLGQLNDYLSKRDFGEITLVSVGPVELKAPVETV